MTAYVLVLGVIVIVAIQMAGAILYVTGSLPHESLLKVFARYLRRGPEEAAADFFPPFETMTRLMKKRRRLYHAIEALLAVGVVVSIASGILEPGILAYSIPAFLIAALVLLIAAGVLSAWIRQLRKMPDTF